MPIANKKRRNALWGAGVGVLLCGAVLTGVSASGALVGNPPTTPPGPLTPAEAAKAPTLHANPLPPTKDWISITSAAAAVAQFQAHVGVTNVTRITAIETTYHGYESVANPTEHMSSFAQITSTSRVWVVVASGRYVSSFTPLGETYTWVAAAYDARAGNELTVTAGPGTWPVWFSSVRPVLATGS